MAKQRHGVLTVGSVEFVRTGGAIVRPGGMIEINRTRSLASLAIATPPLESLIRLFSVIAGTPVGGILITGGTA